MKLIELKTKDDFTLQGPYWGTDVKDKAVVFIHGSTNFYDPDVLYAGATEQFISRAGEILADNGIAVLAVRNRGSGWPEFFNDCVYDIQVYIDFLKEEGYHSIFLAGHSLGAAKASYYAGTTSDHGLAGLVLMSCCPDIHGLYDRDDQLEESRRMVSEVRCNLFFRRGG